MNKLFPIGAITFQLFDNWDNELTCMICEYKKCEYYIETSGVNNHMWRGVHKKCAKLYAPWISLNDC